MSQFDVDALADDLSKASVDSDTFLSFASKGLWLDDSCSARDVVLAIEACENLEVLELKGNTLGVGASEFIGKALEKKAKLKRLLWSDLFTGRSKAEIPPALINLCKGMMVAGVKLVELDLSDNAFGPNGMMGLTDFLKSSCCYSLKVLRLHNNGLGITGGKMLAESLQKCFEDGRKIGEPLQLRVFVSGRGRLENEGAEALAEVFKMMKSLEEVHMPQNGINHDGITALAGAFAVNPNMKILNLSDNTFTERGSYSMAKALEALDKLEEVNFEDCLTRTMGAIALASALEKGHEKLKVLKLSGNEIELDGAMAVVDAVKNKPLMGSLELRDNEFGARGIKSIKNSLAEASAEHVLGNFSDDEDDDEVGEEDGTDEEFLDVDDDDDDDDDVTEDIKEEESTEEDDDDDIPNLGRKLESDIKELVKNPDDMKLKAIINEDPQAISIFLKGTSNKAEGAILSLMKIAQICTEAKSRTNDTIFSYADDFCKKMLKDNENFLVTGILFSLGLIKGEKKKIKLPENRRGPLYLLRHIVHQDYFTKSSKQTVWLILHRFKSLLGEDKELGEEIAKGLSDAGYSCL